ncbi:nucleotide sugar dehydrogenase [Kineococcus indalonis]|uniref:nucleotide sugar dehydrogenase n=1 Tax=Kineococcus indalonis TaxID=2696566 RepID=UPI001413498C|nr:nucleotide sugar dehydrogenase [Kineococcus indalonis]NAZ88051.1 nucleotide sugar dehydrogenase [Kineococcus indalonis]
MHVTVVALGKIGLPLAVQYARAGHEVTGADVDARVVELVAAGRAPWDEEAHLAERLAEVVAAGRLRATTGTTAAVAASDVVVVVVPLVVDEAARPDFAAMDAATRAVAAGLRPGTLVVYETTLPVGTTRGRLVPLLEAGSGLRTGEDLFVAFSPERVLTGRVFADLRRYPKLVGGVDAASARRATAFYEAVLQFDERADLPRPNGVWDLGSAEAAEVAKLAETTYRDVNIALANQFALYAQSLGIDFAAVAEACNSQPYSHLHRPGVAVGGHCIPVYPQLYLAGDPAADVVRTARAANERMPAAAVAMLDRELEALGTPLAGARVAVLGAAYRGGVKETAFSGVFPLVRELAARGAVPVVHDPLFSDAELAERGLAAHHLGEPVDAAVVQADHRAYAALGAADLPGARVLLDGRGVTAEDGWDGVVRVVLGRGRR